MDDLIKLINNDKITIKEVQKLYKIFHENGKINEAEARALLELNSKAKKRCPEFKDIFVEKLFEYIDEEKKQFLLNQIMVLNCGLDENVRALLEALYAKMDLPESLVSLID